MKNSINVLLISHNCPYPPIDGYKVRNYNMYRNLDPLFRCSWLIFGHFTESLKIIDRLKNKLGPSCEHIEIIPESTLKHITLKNPLYKKIFFPHKLSMRAPTYSVKMEEVVNKEISSSKYDIVLFLGFGMFLYCNLRLINNVPYIVDTVDSLSVLMKSYFKKETKIINKIKSYLNYIWAQRYEKIHLSKAKHMIFISDVDAQAVKTNCPQSKIWSISNGVDTEYFKQNLNVKVLAFSMLFTGVMSYSPNNDAMIYFITKIFPLIKKRMNNAFLMIAGPNPSSKLSSLAKNDRQINLMGYVEDIRSVFNKAEVYISPLISGAGVKNKVLEAWAMSKPIVATSLSCSGLDVIDGDNVLIADQPKLFAEKVYQLFIDSDLRDRISKNGRRDVERAYSWESKSKELENCIMDVIHNFG
jgi:glycosyltransferase involved in cell wall biosynthesis